MTERAVATKLVLGALGESESISSIDDRTRLQKLVYLSQAAGVNLGYYFNWYLKGPYSANLAKDYYNMPSQEDAVGFVLRQDLVDRLEAVRLAASDNRKPAQLGGISWLELLASVHYLDNVSKLDSDSVIAKMQREKPHLAPFVNIARGVIADHLAPLPQAN